MLAGAGRRSTSDAWAGGVLEGKVVCAGVCDGCSTSESAATATSCMPSQEISG